ncbi:abscission/NoCut checkpoint regulator isoform X2 [Rana temporaria]|uniref:abscission/NoCut checkpoint regulator isoform X2 n=1 Tax=Rana temporaria TaxID=8407 RepID=UPI001AACB04F|nr:abscission/NoCut checkpoint regulator isoform X2 [Rana temporaria]
MDGRCFSCASKFTIFKKECGCKSCGRAFCAGCLGYTAVLPTYGNAKQKICKKCHESITSGKDQRNSCSKWSPPENYKKRVAALEARQNQQKVMQVGPGMAPGGTNLKYEGLSAEDRAIAERLEKLKQETKPKTVASMAEIESRVQALQKDTQGRVPSLQEMEDRLAILQGRTPPSRTTKPLHQAPDRRTQTEKVDDLITQLRDEATIDQQWNPNAQSQDFSVPPVNNLNKVDQVDSPNDINHELDAEYLEREKDRILRDAAAELQDENTRQEKMLGIAKRLAALQGKDPDKVTVDNIKLPDSDEETEEEGIQRILKQHKLPAQNPPGRSTAVKAQVADSDEEELPWCCICNEDAVLRCHSCDDDLYCKRCFREGHDKFDQKDHQTSIYRPPQKKKGR